MHLLHAFHLWLKQVTKLRSTCVNNVGFYTYEGKSSHYVLDLDPKLAEKNDDLDEFSLQLSLILMGNRSKEVQTLTQLLHVPLSDNEAKGKEVLGFSCTTTHILRPSFSGLHTVQYFENGYISLLKQSELTSLLIQHNQSPDTSIFTLHPNSGSKVRRERGRRKRERKRDQ